MLHHFALREPDNNGGTSGSCRPSGEWKTAYTTYSNDSSVTGQCNFRVAWLQSESTIAMLCNQVHKVIRTLVTAIDQVASEYQHFVGRSPVYSSQAARETPRIRGMRPTKTQGCSSLQTLRPRVLETRSRCRKGKLWSIVGRREYDFRD